MASSAAYTYRFAVGSANGPRSGIWVLWTSGKHGDVYLAAREIAGSLKVSLHPSGAWQAAFTKQLVDKLSQEGKWSRSSRQVDKWRRPDEIAPGITLAYRVLIPHSQLRVSPIEIPASKPVTWIPSVNDDYVSEFSIYLTRPEVIIVTERHEDKPEGAVITATTLANGESLWVVHHLLPNTGQVLSYITDVKARLKGRRPDLSTGDFTSISPSHRLIVGGDDERGTHYFYEFAAISLLA